jgi:2'-5' RNA ligase
MRLFVALDIDASIRARIADFVRSLGPHAPGVRFVGPETYHITLKFLGETSRHADIVQALSPVRFSRFDVTFRGTGFFPTPRAPRVFWTGIEWSPDVPSLPQLAKAVSDALEPLGFEPEKAPYHPHLTLARAGSGSPRPKRGESTNPNMHRLAEDLASLPPPEFGTMTAREFVLYESRLSPQGAQYFARNRFPLG